jgi:hypothetical protein
MSKENRLPAIAIIEKLVNRGLTQSQISTKLGYGPWWASGVRTKGDGVTDDALSKLQDMAIVKKSVADQNTSMDKSKALILSMFASRSVSLSKAYIMKRGLKNGISVGAVENALYALKADESLICPKRGHYKLPDEIKSVVKSNGHSNGNGNITVNARSFKRLMKDVRIIKKMMRKQEAS